VGVSFNHNFIKIYTLYWSWGISINSTLFIFTGLKKIIKIIGQGFSVKEFSEAYR